MQKVYLLLRNNKQSGPYSLDELVGLGLKPFDLVWVDGRSAAWRYPSEVETLKPYVPETPQQTVVNQFGTLSTTEQYIVQHASEKHEELPHKTPINIATAKHIFVSLPNNARVNPIKEYVREEKPFPKQEEPSKNIQIPITEKNTVSAAKGLDTRYSRSLHDVEEDYTNWVFKQKKRRKTISPLWKQVTAFALVIGIGGSVYLATRSSEAKRDTSLPVSVKPTKLQEPVAQEKPETEPVTNSTNEDQVTQNNMGTVTSSPVIKQAVKKEITKKKERNVVTTVANNNSISHKDATQVAPQINNNQVSSDTKQAPTQEITKPNSTQQGKKKTFGEAIKGVFAKFNKKKEGQPQTTVPETASNVPRHADGRTSTRRDDVPNSSPANSSSANTTQAKPAPDLSSIADQLTITTEDHTDNWMMGVSGLKLTLRNHSNITVRSAAVDVSYFDENNQFLEKKTVYFNNVPPNGKATVAAPDQKWADHVDYKLGVIR